MHGAGLLTLEREKEHLEGDIVGGKLNARIEHFSKLGIQGLDVIRRIQYFSALPENLWARKAGPRASVVHGARHGARIAGSWRASRPRASRRAPVVATEAKVVAKGGCIVHGSRLLHLPTHTRCNYNLSSVAFNRYPDSYMARSSFGGRASGE